MKLNSRDLFHTIKNDFQGLNLIGYKDFEKYHVNLFEDSIGPLKRSTPFFREVTERGYLFDIGHGAGFPLLPLAAKLPQISCFGVERLRKKSQACNAIAQKFSLKNVESFSLNVNELIFDLPSVLTFKAVGSIPQCLQHISYSGPISVYFYKGPNWKKELEGTELKGWKLFHFSNFILSEGQKRCFLGFFPVKQSNVPRGTHKKLVSEFLGERGIFG